ncbi:MAG TPA: hypothetical protein VM262_15260 [Acidimicrobiales bacterium]|nr:hypothetical protein [Acidimicrobiales bacterium]
MNARVHWPAVRAGAAVAVAVCLPVALVAQAVVDDDDPGGLAGLLYFLVLAGFAVGGWFAAVRAGDTPYSSGAIAALLGFAVIQTISVVSQTIRGNDIEVVLVVANALLAYGAGLLGAAIVARRRTA